MLNIRHVDHEATYTDCWRVPVQRRAGLYVRGFSMGDMGDRVKPSKPTQVYRDRLV